MDDGKCILEIRGSSSFYPDKIYIIKQKNYSLLEDYDKRKLFDIEKYSEREGKVIIRKKTYTARF